MSMDDLRQRTDEIEWTHPQVQNNILGFILGCLLEGEIGEGGAAETLGIDIISLRGLMETRYGNDWRSVAGDEIFIRRILGGDYDDMATILNMTREQMAAMRRQQIEDLWNEQ